MTKGGQYQPGHSLQAEPGKARGFLSPLRRTTSPGSHVARAFAPQKSDGVPRVGGQPILASTAVKVQQSLVGSLDQYGVQCTWKNSWLFSIRWERFTQSTSACWSRNVWKQWLTPFKLPATCRWVQNTTGNLPAAARLPEEPPYDAIRLEDCDSQQAFIRNLGVEWQTH